mgnify:FL=1
MEEQIKQAKKIISWSGLGCRIFSVVGIVTTLIYLINISSGNFKKNYNFLKNTVIILGTSLTVGAIGSIADSSKKNKALTELLVESTNSASQLPITEYSDLNEDN